ncbi:MAG: 2-hydroxyacyl-CoA dehydratase family protein [Deltaproteobacteria bacterium]|nr:2-hydroxyacyl-CoA dehydratase family protein [Deltaproteobacteria bacterium]
MASDPPRAETLRKFDVMSEHSLLALEEAKAAGRKVVGIYCVFAPKELVRAVGAIPVGLCGKKEDPIPAAEKTLPANLCPLIKSSYGYAVTDTCPFNHRADFVIGETTCDGKKKMYELLARVKPVYLMHMPHRQDDAASLAYWQEEVGRLKEYLERQTGQEITPEELSRQIRLHNRKRRLLQELVSLNTGEVLPITARDTLLVMESKSYAADLEAYVALLEELIAELRDMQARGAAAVPAGAPRVLFTGCPIGKGSEKLLAVLEEAGAAVVAQEHCSGIKAFHHLVDEEGDPLEALARRYLATPCSCMTPNRPRLELLADLAQEFRAQGAVDLTWQFCHTYNVEAQLVKEHLRETRDLPVLHLESDYSQADREQLRVRVEAFLEMLA